MSRLEALREEETMARRQLDRKLGELAAMVAESQRAVLLDQHPPVNRLAVKAAAIEDAVDIWEACKAGIAGHQRRQQIETAAAARRRV